MEAQQSPPTTKDYPDARVPQPEGGETAGTPNYLVGAGRAPPPPACTPGCQSSPYFLSPNTPVEDVIKYLDPQYIDRMAVPDAMKLQFILAEEQAIPERAALLEQVKNLQPILDSASIQAVPDHAAKLQRLSQIHIQQQEKRHDLTDSVKTLLESYNKMTLLLSKQLLQWNEILTRLEAAKQAKPVAE
ncbi:dynactin subunit 3 [Manacus vitellinus]|nr:dynactin subunit 3 [Manacus vitellinus]